MAANAAPELTPELIMEFNRRVLEGQELDADTEPGKVRRHSVGVGRYRGAPAEDCEHLLGELCDWLNRSWTDDIDPVPAELRFTVTLLKAVLAHLYLAWIHPFGDGNGRTARLLEFLILVSYGVPSPAAHLLSNHYNLTRDRYYRRLEQSSQSLSGVAEFVSYALEGFVDGLREQVRAVRAQQMRVTWINYVHGQFGAQRMTDTQRRRREVVLALQPNKPVPKSEIPNLNPAIARLYGTKGEKTLSRDVNALMDKGLIRRTQEGYLPRTELVEAFLPIRADLDD